MLNRVSLVAIMCVAISASGYAGDTCKSFEKYQKKTSSKQLELIEKELNTSKKDWSVSDLTTLKQKILTCAEQRKEKQKSKKVFGALLGAVGGAVASKEGQQVETAAAGAALATSLFEGTNDKKMLSYQASIKDIEQSIDTIQQVAKEDEEAKARAIVEAEERQLEAERQAVLNQQATEQKKQEDTLVAEMDMWLALAHVNDQQFVKALDTANQCVEHKYLEYDYGVYSRNNKGPVADKCFQTVSKLEGEKKKKVAQYVEATIAKHSAQVLQIGLSDEVLDSVYANVTLRAYLSVLLEYDDVRIFSENHPLYDVTIVLKPTGVSSTKYHFDYDYGDLRAKAIDDQILGGFRPVQLLKEKEFSFAGLYIEPYQRQIRAAMQF